MNRIRFRHVMPVALVWVLAWSGALNAAGPESVQATADQPEGPGFRFRLEVPQPRLTPRDDGFMQVELDGFRTREERPGFPDVPRRTVLVAIPPGADPRLEVRAIPAPGLGGVLPLPVAHRDVVLGPEDLEPLSRPETAELHRTKLMTRPRRESFRADPGVYEARTVFPGRIAWLGKTGVLRDQRYVEVHMAPVRYDGRNRGLQVHEALELTVHFDGALPGAARPPAETEFESIYRESFVNYPQSRGLRLDSWAPAATQPEEHLEPPTTRAGGSPLYRIRVRQDGVVRLDHATLSAAGFAAHPVSRWRLTNRGSAVPLHVRDDGPTPDTLEPGEWVQFYGEALDDEPETLLNFDIDNTEEDLFEAADFSDENVYFLDVAVSAQPAMSTRDATPPNGTVEAAFDETMHAETDDFLRPLGGGDPWYSWPPVIASSSTESSRLIQVALPGLKSASDPIAVRVLMRGLSPYTDQNDAQLDPDHLTEIIVRNDSAVELKTDPAAWDGRSIFMHDFSYAGGSVTQGLEIEMKALPLHVGSLQNAIALDYIEIDYRRSFTAIGDVLEFSWPDAAAEFLVGGLVAADAVVYEITPAGAGQPVQPVRLTGVSAGAGTQRFAIVNEPGIPDGTQRRFVVAAGSGIANLAAGPDFATDAVSDLRSNANQADLIVIAHPDVLDLDPGSGLSRLLAHRASPAGGNLASKVALLQDVYDEFGDGLEGPPAIREFLRWVLSTDPGEGWASPKPRYVILLGDASYDYKAGTPFGNYVPTLLMFRDFIELSYYASDTLLAAVSGPGDQIADYLIGRVPVRSVAEANTVLHKIVDHELLGDTDSWRSHVLLVSDRGKSGTEAVEAAEFQTINDDAAAMMPAGYSNTHLRYYQDYYANFCPTSGSCAVPQRLLAGQAANGDIDGELNAGGGGTAIVQYIGHGNFYSWSEEAIWDERDPSCPTTQSCQVQSGAEDLTNAARLPFLLVHNCLTGGFHWTWHDAGIVDGTVGEAWLKRSGGGAFAALAPTGLSFNFISGAVVDEVWDEFFGPTKQRLIGPAALRAAVTMCALGGSTTQACQFYALLGDPASRIGLPSVDPPTAVSVTGGNMEAQLDWTAAPAPATGHHVYRSCVAGTEDCSSAWVRATASPVAGTSYTDGGVLNTQTYRFYVTGVDAQGFESRWSNFNTDCPGGSDCVEATPLNPNPPGAPTGLDLTDPGTGLLQLDWTPNPEADVDFYTVHYGTASGVYTAQMQVGNQTRVVLNGTTPGVTYYAAITATNTSARTSALSAEDSEFAVFAPGVRLPDFIDDLRVDAPGADAVLQWSEVTTDIWGKPFTVAGYDVYRGTGANYTPGGLVWQDQCIAACSSWIDVGAVAAPEGFYYRVAATDGAGGSGGLGFELPGLILNLEVAPSVLTPGDVRLSWPAVAATLDGTPAQILQYRVFVSDQPFTPADVRTGVLTPTLTVTEPFAELPPPIGEGYYAVLAEDILGQTSPY